MAILLFLPVHVQDNARERGEISQITCTSPLGFYLLARWEGSSLHPSKEMLRLLLVIFKWNGNVVTATSQVGANVYYVDDNSLWNGLGEQALDVTDLPCNHETLRTIEPRIRAEAQSIQSLPSPPGRWSLPTCSQIFSWGMKIYGTRLGQPHKEFLPYLTSASNTLYKIARTEVRSTVSSKVTHRQIHAANLDTAA